MPSHSDALDNLIRYETESRLSWGIEQLDEETGGIYPGDFCLIAGPPHGGKTQFGLSVFLANPTIKMAFFSPDEGHEFVLLKILRMMLNLSEVDMRIALRKNRSKIQPLVEDLEDRIAIFDTKSPKDFERCLKIAEAKMDGLDLVVYDYIGQFGDSIANMAWRMNFLKEKARHMDVPIIALHQSNRSGFSSQYEPTLASLKEAGEAESFIVFWVRGPWLKSFNGKFHADDQELIAQYQATPWRELWILKNKRGRTGQPMNLFFSKGSRLTE